MSFKNGRQLRFVVASIFLLHSASNSSRSDSNSSRSENEKLLIQEFLDKYSVGLKIIEAQYNSIQVEGTVNGEYIFPKGAPSVSRKSDYILQYYRSGKYTKLIRTELHDDRNVSLTELVYVDEPHRLFIVERGVGSKEYRLNHLGHRKGESIERMNSYINKFIKSPCTFNGLPVSTVIKLPGFVVKKLTTLYGSDGGCVRIDFDYNPSSAIRPEIPWIKALSGWWIVDPDHGWVLRQYQVAERGSPVIWTGRVEYAIEQGAAKLSKVSLNDGADYRAGFKYEFDCKTFEYKSTPEKEFTLAAYGLGDAELPPGRTFNWSPYWFFGLAALAIVVSVILRRRAEQ